MKINVNGLLVEIDEEEPIPDDEYCEMYAQFHEKENGNLINMPYLYILNANDNFLQLL